MVYQWLADLVVLIHFMFIIFALAGGFLAWKWRRVLWIHLPAALWAALIEFTGGICPLTPLENRLRAMGGSNTYASDFVEHYLEALIYPVALTRQMQVILGVMIVLVNVGIYAFVWRRSRGLSGGA
jgi:hypothetical protein